MWSSRPCFGRVSVFARVAAQVALCSFMVIATLVLHRRRGLSLICNAYDPSDVAMARMEWVFYLSKALDFMDTGMWARSRSCAAVVSCLPSLYGYATQLCDCCFCCVGCAVFIIARGAWVRFSFLHIYHHSVRTSIAPVPWTFGGSVAPEFTLHVHNVCVCILDVRASSSCTGGWHTLGTAATRTSLSLPTHSSTS